MQTLGNPHKLLYNAPMSRPHIFVATHHKSGTVWMLSTFKRMAVANKFQFYDVNEAVPGWMKHPAKKDVFDSLCAAAEAQSSEPSIFFDYHAEFPDLSACLDDSGACGIHVVRDPRDMLLSAVRFHLTADEPWLHVPDDRFGGLTYQQKIDSYDCLEDQIRFEMQYNMGWVIRKMHRFDAQGVFRDVHYEDLIEDNSMVLWHELCIEFGLVGREIINALDSFWRSSIFGDMKKVAQSGTNAHIKNAKPRQWQTLLSDAMIEEIESMFGDEIDGLGYQRANEIVGV